MDDVNGYILTNRFVSSSFRLTCKDMLWEVDPLSAIWYAKITRKWMYMHAIEIQVIPEC